MYICVYITEFFFYIHLHIASVIYTLWMFSVDLMPFLFDFLIAIFIVGLVGAYVCLDAGAHFIHLRTCGLYAHLYRLFTVTFTCYVSCECSVVY